MKLRRETTLRGLDKVLLEDIVVEDDSPIGAVFSDTGVRRVEIERGDGTVAIYTRWEPS